MVDDLVNGAMGAKGVRKLCRQWTILLFFWLAWPALEGQKRVSDPIELEL